MFVVCEYILYSWFEYCVNDTQYYIIYTHMCVGQRSYDSQEVQKYSKIILRYFIANIFLCLLCVNIHYVASFNNVPLIFSII